MGKLKSYQGKVHSSLRSLNKRLGEYAADLIGRIEKEDAQVYRQERGFRDRNRVSPA